MFTGNRSPRKWSSLADIPKTSDDNEAKNYPFYQQRRLFYDPVADFDQNDRRTKQRTREGTDYQIRGTSQSLNPTDSCAEKDTAAKSENSLQIVQPRILSSRYERHNSDKEKNVDRMRQPLEHAPQLLKSGESGNPVRTADKKKTIDHAMRPSPVPKQEFNSRENKADRYTAAIRAIQPSSIQKLEWELKSCEKESKAAEKNETVHNGKQTSLVKDRDLELKPFEYCVKPDKKKETGVRGLRRKPVKQPELDFKSGNDKVETDEKKETGVLNSDSIFSERLAILRDLDFYAKESRARVSETRQFSLEEEDVCYRPLPRFSKGKYFPEKLMNNGLLSHMKTDTTEATGLQDLNKSEDYGYFFDLKPMTQSKLYEKASSPDLNSVLDAPIPAASTVNSLDSTKSGLLQNPVKPSTLVRVPKNPVKEVEIQPENIRLFKVLMKAKIFDITEFPCSITCDEENGKVVLAGDDDFIRDVASSIRQVAFVMASCQVSRDGGFLCTAKGEQWIAEEFENLGIPAIIYTKDQVTYVLAKDESHLDSVTTIFNQILVSQMVTLDESILPYLKSLEWNKTVKIFQANFMIQVISDYKSARILVKGCREDVDAVTATIKALLYNEHSESSQHLPLTHQYQKSADYKMSSQPGEASAQPKVIVVKGDIATFAHADVLVNPIALKTNSLKVAGAVSWSFFKAGREKLQKEFEKAGAPIKFGTDVTVTGPAGTIRAKKIFHAAIEHMRNAESIELLTALIKTCLKKAEEEKLTSIAFPTLGCGYLGYNQADVSRCFAKAAIGSVLQIYIVAYKQDLYEKFKTDFMAQEPTDVGKSTSCDSAALVSQKMPPAVVPKAEVKRYNDPYQTVATDTKEMLQRYNDPYQTVATDTKEMLQRYNDPYQTVKTDTKEISPTVVPKTEVKRYINPPSTVKTDTKEMAPAVAPKAEVKRYINPPPTVKTDTKEMPPAVAPKSEVNSYINPPQTVKTDTKEMSIIHPSIAQLNDEVVAKIQSLQSIEVQVEIDVSESTITLTGSKDKLVDVKQRILKELTEDELLQRNLSYIKKHKGVKEYLIALGSMSTLEIPEYWTTSSGQHVTNTSVSKRLPLVKGSPVYKTVELLIKDSWDSTKGGALTGINVTNIWIVANQNLFLNYQFKLKAFALRAADRPFKAITDLEEPEIITKTVKGTDFISEQLVSEVNEVYLCHGTGHVNEIEKSGIDSRLFAESGNFGKGAYFAESSTKANQYANPISGKSTTEAKRYMFVARVLLGEPFLCKKAYYNLKKAPCCSGCKGSCTADHPVCDSVVGTSLRFREFIVYHPEQSYPEFLVEYKLSGQPTGISEP